MNNFKTFRELKLTLLTLCVYLFLLNPTGYAQTSAVADLIMPDENAICQDNATRVAAIVDFNRLLNAAVDETINLITPLCKKSEKALEGGVIFSECDLEKGIESFHINRYREDNHNTGYLVINPFCANEIYAAIIKKLGKGGQRNDPVGIYWQSEEVIEFKEGDQVNHFRPTIVFSQPQSGVFELSWGIDN